MATEIVWWGVAINLVLFIRVLLETPKALRTNAEAELLQQQANLLWAEVEQEKVKRGVTDADYQRELHAAHEAVLELIKLKHQLRAEETPCASADS